MIVERRLAPQSAGPEPRRIDTDYDADTAFFQPATTITVHHL